MRPGPPYRVAAQKTAALLGFTLAEPALDRAALVFHHWRCRGHRRTRCSAARTGLGPVAAGLASGAAMSAIVDEGLRGTLATVLPPDDDGDGEGGTNPELLRMFWVRPSTTRTCPDCLSHDEGFWRATWQMPWHFTCVQHRRLLLDRCPACRTPCGRERGTGDEGRLVPGPSMPGPARCGAVAAPMPRPPPVITVSGRVPASPRVGGGLTAATLVAAGVPTRPRTTIVERGDGLSAATSAGRRPAQTSSRSRAASTTERASSPW